jgi:histidinol phosphatase-like enzyme (inositol monophosphatase family)
MAAVPPDLRNILDFAVEIAQQAGSLTLAWFNTGVAVDLKADQSPVTIADRSAEKHLRERIEAAYPDHGVLGEEFGEKAGRVPARWILDPIDGTVSFISGVPLYSVLVGLEWGGEMVAGVIHLPALGETIYAARGLGCHWNGRRARVSDVADLSQARLLTTGTKHFAKFGRQPGYERLLAACKLDRGWSDAYAYALVATGRAEIVLDPAMAIWDTAALLPCVTEAGGTLTDWKGNTTHAAPEAIATNGKLLPAVMACIAG